MKKTLAIAAVVALVGGLATFASAHGGWGGGHMWERDYNDYGRGRHMYSKDFDDRGRGYGPSSGSGRPFVSGRKARATSPRRKITLM